MRNLVVINYEQEQIILGTLLGDAGLSRPRINSALQIKHCEKDKDYVFWKYQKLFSTGLFKNPPKPVITMKLIKPHANWFIKSCRDPILTEYRQLFYPNGKKIVPTEVLNKLGPLGLAVWYMDDGSYGHYTNPESGSRYEIVRLQMGDFNLEDVTKTRDWLQNRFGIGLNINGRRSHSLVRVKREEVSKFLEIVQPHIVPCMFRKIRYLSRL